MNKFVQQNLKKVIVDLTDYYAAPSTAFFTLTQFTISF